MRLISTLVTLLLVTGITATAQPRFEVGIEGGVVSDRYQIHSTDGRLSRTACISGYGGANFRLNIKDNIFFELGLLATEYVGGFKVRDRYEYTSNSDEVLFFPVRVGYKLRIIEDLWIAPRIGLAPAVKTLNQLSAGNMQTGTDEYSYITQGINKNFFLLTNTGLALEWKAWHKVKLQFAVDNYRGFQRIVTWDIYYSSNGGMQQNGQLIGKGNFTSYSFGLKYLIN